MIITGEKATGGSGLLQMTGSGELITKSLKTDNKRIIRGQQIRMTTPDENGNNTAYRYVNRGSTSSTTDFINVKGYDRFTLFVQPCINGNATSPIAPTVYFQKWSGVSAEWSSVQDAGTYVWSVNTGAAPLPWVFTDRMGQGPLWNALQGQFCNAELEYLTVSFKTHTSGPTDACAWTLEVHLF
jgi:hypothetical protein